MTPFRVIPAGVVLAVVWVMAGVALAPVGSAAPPPLASAPASVVADPVLVAAGDIACAPNDPSFSGSDPAACQMRATAHQIIGVAPNYLLPLGDLQYGGSGGQGVQPSAAEYQGSYNPSWGAIAGQVPGLVVRPVPGNHEYGDTNGGNPPLASGSTYYDNFGPNGLNELPAGVSSAANDYFSYTIPVNGGSWHVIALDSECNTAVGGCGPGSAQETWLRNDLAAHPNTCTLAYWHEPRWTYGGQQGVPEYAAFWNDLVAARATMVLNGHDHLYEHLGPMDAAGNPTPGGLTQFTVGTGGENHEGAAPPGPTVIAQDDTDFGVLKLTLHASSADYAFQTTTGTTPDTGAVSCPSVIAPGAPVIGSAVAGNASATVGFTAPASNGGAPITRYTATAHPGGLTGTSTGSPVTVTGLTNGTAYTFTVTATNSAGTTSVSSAVSNSVTPTTPALASATTVAVTPNAGVNVAVIVFATLTPNTAGGTVAFTTDGNTTPIEGCAARPVTAGSANCVTAFTTAGPHTVTATYSGDGTDAGSSGTMPLTVTATPDFFQIAFGLLIQFVHTFHLFGF